MNRVVHFEIHASEPERAAKFYSEVFSWNFKEWTFEGVQLPEENRYWVVYTGAENEPGINGGMVIRRSAPPADGQAVNAYVCTMEVSSVDEYIERSVKAGGNNAVPKMPIPGVGWLAYCKDTEGNLFGIMENDTSAG